MTKVTTPILRMIGNLKMIDILSGIFLILGILILFKNLMPPVKEKVTIEITHYSIIDTLSFEDSLLNKIFEIRLEHPYIVFAQAIEESGRFNSLIFRENNNLFGMKMPERRPTTAIGINRKHAVYRNWQECLYDYALFQSAYMRNLTEEEYLAKLGRSYAESEGYEQRIKFLKESVKLKQLFALK